MVKLLALTAVSALTFGCASTPPALPDVPRQKPVAAMQAEPAVLCQLRPEFDNLVLADQLAMVDNCTALRAEQYRRLERKWGELRGWIEGE